MNNTQKVTFSPCEWFPQATTHIFGCALPLERAQPLFSHIYLIIIFPPLRISQYLDYIDNGGVKMFVFVMIALLLLGFTFRCTV